MYIIDYVMNYLTIGPAETRAFPSSFEVYFTKFFQTIAKSSALTFHSFASL